MRISKKPKFNQLEIDRFKFNLPKIEYPQDFEQFPEETKSRININSNGITGKKQLSQLLIPRFHGSFEIPEISFSYFDTYTKKYKTLSYPSSIIKVQKNNNSNISTTTNFIYSISNNIGKRRNYYPAPNGYEDAIILAKNVKK